MPSVTIDPDILIKAMTAAIQAAIQMPSAAEEPVKAKAKRGRPKKSTNSNMCPNCSEAYMYCACKDNPLNKKESNIEIISVEKEVVEDANKQDDFIRKPNSHIFAAKKISNSGLSNKQVTESVLENRKQQKFIDVDNIPHEKQNWQPTERRPPAQMLDFVCTNCNQPFKDYPVNVQQAFFKISGSDMPANQDGCIVIKCPKCSTR